MVAPVVNPTLAVAGSPSSSRSHWPASSSTALVPGIGSRMAAFWSQAVTSQSAATATGCVPPITQP